MRMSVLAVLAILLHGLLQSLRPGASADRLEESPRAGPQLISRQERIAEGRINKYRSIRRCMKSLWKE